MSDSMGRLYVVATPIGNLADFSFRAITVLKQVDWIAAEDTRHVQALLKNYGISNKLVSLHQHNEEKTAPVLLKKLQQGQSIALVSDAGTPLVSDPGMPLVKLAMDADISVIPIPGACALIAALSVSGLPLSHFSFAGFLPRTSSARKKFFTQMLYCHSTWVVYESCHRILASLRDMAEILPLDRQVVIAREITKLHETIIKATLEDMLLLVEQDDNMRKGEFVIIVEGAEKEKNNSEITVEHDRILRILLQECTIKTAVAMAVKITGARKRVLYQAAIKMTNDK